MTLDSLLVGSLSFSVDMNDYSTVLPFEKLLNEAATCGLEMSYMRLMTDEAVPSESWSLN